jgi:adenylate kinase family enzyme
VKLCEGPGTSYTAGAYRDTQEKRGIAARELLPKAQEKGRCSCNFLVFQRWLVAQDNAKGQSLDSRDVPAQGCVYRSCNDPARLLAMSHMRRHSVESKSSEYALLLVGLHSSGKTTLSQAIASTGPFAIFELGDGVRDEARRQRETNLVRVASQILASDEPTKLVKLAVRRARSTPGQIPIFVGARTTIERDLLASLFPQLLVIGLNTPDPVRRDRWKRRQIMATDHWTERERWEGRWQTRMLIVQSDLRLTGTDSIPSMCKRVEAAIRRKWRLKNVWQ